MTINFAVLWDGRALPDWQQRCVQRLLMVEGVRAVLLVSAHRAPAAAPACDGLSSLPVLRLADAEQYLRALMQPYDLDFILSFLAAPAIAPSAWRELLALARHGVWAFSFGDWVRYRGEPAAYWEVYDAQPVTAAMLVRLQERDDSVRVLREGYFRTIQLSPRRNREQLLARITHWPAQLCIDLQSGVPERLTSPPLISAVPARAAPTQVQQLRLRLRIALRVLRVVLRGLFRHDQWNVAAIERPIADFLRDSGSREAAWLPTPKRSEFFADPFGVRREGQLTIFYEDFNFRNNRGTIAAIESGSNAAHKKSVAKPVAIGPTPAVHLSYPLLLEHEGRLLCIPEAHQAAHIGIYELRHFPDQWQRIATVLEGLAIVDATLFEHEGRWWLFGSEPTATGTSCELNLWHAPRLTGPWTAHLQNPVKIDARSARPGGTPFYDRGILYRPAQDCSETYGGRIVINRIVKLTPGSFEETVQSYVEPDPDGPYPDGLHTLSRVGQTTLIDGKRVIFSPPEFRRVFAHFVRSAWRRATRGVTS